MPQGDPHGFGGAAFVRFVQTSTASRGGELREVQIRIQKDTDDLGNWVVQLMLVPGGSPDHTARGVMAASMVENTQVPIGPSTLVARFAGTRLVQGLPYAVVVSRLGDARVRVPVSAAATCRNSKMYAASGEQPFTAGEADMIVAVLVAAQGVSNARDRRTGTRNEPG